MVCVCVCVCTARMCMCVCECLFLSVYVCIVYILSSMGRNFSMEFWLSFEVVWLKFNW